MNDEIEIIKKQLPDMAGILNAIPGERFEIKGAQTLLIVQRRMEDTELSFRTAHKARRDRLHRGLRPS